MRHVLSRVLPSFALLVGLGCGGDVETSTSGGGGSSSSGGGAAGSSSSSSSSGGGGAGGGMMQCTSEVCNGLDDDCNGVVDDGASCNEPGEVCAAGACKAACTSPIANPCADGDVCNVSDKAPGACVAPASGCVVTGPFTPCGNFICGPGSTCDKQTAGCYGSLPCTGFACEGSVCYGINCPCMRPPPECAPATLAQLNDPAFVAGLVDLDFDLACNAWGVTVLSGPDYLRKMDPTGQMSVVQGVTNLNMGEVAAIQGEQGTFGGTVTEVGLTYNCCAGCGCQGTPQGVAYYDQATGMLPLVIPSQQITTGAGPFQSSYLDTGPQGLTWGLTRTLFVGNVAADGDFHTVQLDIGASSLVTTFSARVYAASPYDATRMLVALANREIVLLDVYDKSSLTFATMPLDVTSLARDPFTGHVYVSLYGGEIRELDSAGVDLGVFAKAAKTGRIALARDNYLYHVAVAPVGAASIERFALPATY